MYRRKYPLAHHSPAKRELMAIGITHESVVTGDIKPLVEKLGFMIEHHDIAMLWEGRITFFFEGWDEDPRETAEIPEIRSYFQSVTGAWPYWLHFVEKVGDTLPHVLRLLCNGSYERIKPGLVGWRFTNIDEVGVQLQRLFTDMNRLHERLGVSVHINERISEEVAQLLENTLQ